MSRKEEAGLIEINFSVENYFWGISISGSCGQGCALPNKSCQSCRTNGSLFI